MMLVEEQGKIFLITVAIGGLAGFLYDVYRVVRVRNNLRGWPGALGDLLFWAVATAVVFLLLLQTNQGELRLYVVLGLLGGALLYFSSMSRFAFRFVDFVWHLAGKVENLLFVLLEYLGRALLFPLRRSFIVIVWPLKVSYSGGRYLGHATAEGMKRRSGEFLISMRVRAGNWKHLIGRNKRK